MWLLMMSQFVQLDTILIVDERMLFLSDCKMRLVVEVAATE